MLPSGYINNSHSNQQPEMTQNMNGAGEESFLRRKLNALTDQHLNLGSNLFESTSEFAKMTESTLRKVELKKRKASLIEQNTELLGVIEKTRDQVVEVRNEVKNEKRETKRAKRALLEEVDRLKKVCENELAKRMEAEAEQKRLRAALDKKERETIMYQFDLDIAEWLAEEKEENEIIGAFTLDP